MPDEKPRHDEPASDDPRPAERSRPDPGGPDASATEGPSRPLLHALLVGIDAYPQGEIAGGAKIEPLSGCVPDALEMHRFLVASDVDPCRIRLLTSPSVDAEGSPRPAPLPTKAHLVRAIRELCAAARPGEQALLHFSGHGTFLQTAFPELKEAHGGYDAALVPWDGALGQRPLLRDVELAHLLREFVEKGVQVTVILDACHGGGFGFRRHVPVVGRTRLARELCCLSRPLGDEVASREELLATWDWWCKPADGLRCWWPNWQTGDGGWLPTPRGYVLLAACRADQEAREIDLPDGTHQGLLTHLLLQVLNGSGRQLSYEELHARVEAGALEWTADQSPQREGEVQLEVLGGVLRPPLAGIRTLRRDGRRLLLNAGAAHGLRLRALVRAAEPVSAEERDLTGASTEPLARVVELEADRAWVELVEPAGPDPTETASRVSAAASAPRLPLWVVESPGDDELSSAIRFATAAGGESAQGIVAEAVKELASDRHAFLRLAGDGEPAELEVRLGDNGGFVIHDGHGDLLARLSGATSRRASDLLRSLGHLARFRNVERLRNPVRRADLAGRVELAAELVADGEDLLAPRPRTVPLPRRRGVYQVQVGQPVCLKLRNRSRRDLYCAVLDLCPDFSVRVIHPPPTGKPTHLVERGPREATEHCVVIRAGLPDGYEAGRDVLKLMACVRPTDFRWLELDPLGSDVLRSAPASLPDDPLQALFVRWALDPLRGGDDGVPPADEWTTVQIETCIRAS